MTEKSLDHLFAFVRSAPAETGVADVARWMDSALPASAPSSPAGKSFLLKPKYMAFVSCMTASLIGALLYFSGTGNKHTDQKKSRDPLEKQVAVPADTTLQETLPDPLPQPVLHPRLSSKVARADSFAALAQASDSLFASVPEEKNLPFPEPTVHSGSDTAKQPAATGMGNVAGSWLSLNDSLFVDTVFNGVKALVFKGRVNDKIVVKGSDRVNVALHFNYRYKVKGILVRKKNQCVLRYEKKDSVLMIQVDRNNSVNIGVSYSKETSGLIVEVPDNIAVQVKTTYGDIDASGLSGNEFDFQTSYGVVNVSALSGNIRLNSGYGDIKATQLNGAIDINTGYGDVVGKDITVSGHLNIKSGYGDIDLQINNHVAECRFDLKTGYGKVQMKRADMELDASGKLVFGTGNIVLSAKSGMGDIFIR